MRKLFILLAAVAFVFAFTAPAKAEVSISGYAAFNTYMIDVDPPAPAQDDSDLAWSMDRICSRITFAFKEGPFGAVVELRPFTANMVRHWWGTWNFGAATLGIGQFWTPDFQGISTAKYMCGTPGGDYGDMGGSLRAEQVQLQFGNFKISGAAPVTRAHVVTGATNWDTSMPKLIASYSLNVAMVGLNFFGAYQSIDDKIVATDTSYSVDSYSVGFNAALGLGAFTVKALLWTGTNITEMGYSSIGFAATWDGTSVRDADYMGYGLDFQWKLNDAWTLTAGYLAGESELDMPGTWEDPSSSYHVNATWRVAKNVYISPEYAVESRDDITENGVVTEEGETTYIGVYWQIKF